MGAEPRPYSPEYGAAPVGRCWKIPAKRPSQIETMCFDLKRKRTRPQWGPLARGMRRSHRAIRSFRSITVLRKRSERRALRRGSLWRFLFPVSFPLKETGSRHSAKSPRPVPVPAAAVTSPPLALRETASGPPPLKGRQDRLPFRGAGAKRLRGQPRLSSFVPRKPPSPVQTPVPPQRATTPSPSLRSPTRGCGNP